MNVKDHWTTDELKAPSPDDGGGGTPNDVRLLFPATAIPNVHTIAATDTSTITRSSMRSSISIRIAGSASPTMDDKDTQALSAYHEYRMHQRITASTSASAASSRSRSAPSTSHKIAMEAIPSLYDLQCNAAAYSCSLQPRLNQDHENHRRRRHVRFDDYPAWNIELATPMQEIDNGDDNVPDQDADDGVFELDL